MSVGCEDGLIVAEKGERVDSDAVPIVDNCALQITHVKLPANARGNEARSIGWEGRAGKRLVIGVRNLCVKLQLFNVKDEQLGRFLGSANDEKFGVGRPGDERYAVGVALERLQLLEVEALGVDIPDDAERVLRSRRQFETIWWEFAVPHFVGMLVKHLRNEMQWNLWTKTSRESHLKRMNGESVGSVGTIVICQQWHVVDWGLPSHVVMGAVFCLQLNSLTQQRVKTTWR